VNQEVWLLAIENIDKFDSTRGAFRDWLLGIARHRALRRWRDPQRERSIRETAADESFVAIVQKKTEKPTDLSEAFQSR
jgi:DNA-directed RNA polymerase specialized sigma24 family protein